MPMMLKVPCIMKGKTNEQKQAIDDEWRLLPETVLPEDSFPDMDKISPDEFWSIYRNRNFRIWRNLLLKFFLATMQMPIQKESSEL